MTWRGRPVGSGVRLEQGLEVQRLQPAVPIGFATTPSKTRLSRRTSMLQPCLRTGPDIRRRHGVRSLPSLAIHLLDGEALRPGFSPDERDDPTVAREYLKGLGRRDG